jgi:hypothetical protein
MSIGPRDRVVESLLRGRGTTAERSPDCLDAELLAAWVDDGLDPALSARAEAHVSNCAYCQTVVASMVHVADAIGATSSERSEPAWWQLNIRWLVPILGAVTAGLLWMVVPRETPQSVTPVVQESKDIAGARAEPSDARAPQQAAAAPSVAPPASSPAAAPVEQLTRKTRPAEAPALSKEIDRQARDQASAMAKAEAPSAREEQTAPERRRDADRLAETVSPAPVPAPAPAAPPPPAGALGATSAMQNRAFADAPPTIASRDAAVQWRIRNGSVVERSVDGGGTWVATEGNAGTGVLAGASPAPEVCWLVGRGGLVLVTRDARTWRRASAPVAEDLVGVEAVDDRRAIVRTAGGASYETDDGGATWRRAR